MMWGVVVVVVVVVEVVDWGGEFVCEGGCVCVKAYSFRDLESKEERRFGNGRNGSCDDAGNGNVVGSWIAWCVSPGSTVSVAGFRRAELRGGTPGGVRLSVKTPVGCGDEARALDRMGAGKGALGAGEGALGAARCGSFNLVGRRRTGVSPIDFFDSPVAGLESNIGLDTAI